MTLFRGGTRFYGQNDFIDIWAFLKVPPPHIAQYVLEIVPRRRTRHLALFSCGIAQVSLRYPSFYGGIDPPLESSADARGRGIASNLFMLRRSKSHCAGHGGIAERVSRNAGHYAKSCSKHMRYCSSTLSLIEPRKGIPKNLCSQVLGEVQVNFLG